MSGKKRKIKPIKNLEWLLFLLMIVLVSSFLAFATFITEGSKASMSWVKDVIGTSTGLVAAVMVWVQLKRTERLNEANYIKDLNNQFITNKEMCEVEHALELYYNEVTEGEESPILHLDLSRDGKDCQKMINYLVYLESLASIIQQGVLHIEIIHNVFAYRFFLAVNNPIVQMAEIIPYADYYRGCFILAEKWEKELRHKNEMVIPLKETMLRVGLCRPDGVTIRRAKAEESDAIASVLYQTDEYIYPYAFPLAANGIEALSCLIRKSEGVLSYRNITVVEVNKEIKSVIWISSPGIKWDTQKNWELIKTIHGDKEKFFYAAEHYFEKLNTESIDEIEVIAIATDKNSMRKGYAHHLLAAVSNRFLHKKLILSVLARNKPAIELYENLFFVKRPGTIKGFAATENKLPEVIRMVRPVLCQRDF